MRTLIPLTLLLAACGGKGDDANRDTADDSTTSDTNDDPTDTDTDTDSDTDTDTTPTTGLDGPCGSPYIPDAIEVMTVGTKLYAHVDGCVVVQSIDTYNTGRVQVIQLDDGGQTVTDPVPATPSFTQTATISDDGSVLQFLDQEAWHVGRYDGDVWQTAANLTGFLSWISPDGTWAVFRDGSQMKGISVDGATPPGFGSELIYADTVAFGAEMTADGEWIVINTTDSLVAGDINYEDDVYAINKAGDIVWLSQAEGGGTTDGRSTNPVISHDGRFVAFDSTATDLIATDANGRVQDVFLVDRDVDGNGVFDEQGQTSTSLISASTGGTQATNGGYQQASLTDDGRFVAFHGSGLGLDPAVTSFSEFNVYVHDTQTGTTQLVSTRTGVLAARDSAGEAHISPDGETIAFGGVPGAMNNGVFANIYLAANPLFN